MVLRAIRFLGITVVALVLLVVLAIAGALGYRAQLQHDNLVAVQVTSAHGINEASFVDINGLPQWVQIHGDDKANPVLLFVNGGMSMIPFTFRSMRPWEKAFTVVHWDQRGTGRTYLRNGGADSTCTGMDQVVNDGLRVAEYVRSRLGKDKLIVMGESFGGAIALEMVRARPAIFQAYVGTGQSSDIPGDRRLSYQLLLERLRAVDDSEGVRKLTAAGPPPYHGLPHGTIAEQLMSKYVSPYLDAEDDGALSRDYLFAPGYSLREALQVLQVAPKQRSILVKAARQYNALARGTDFSVPLFFLEGTDDLLNPTELVSRYLGKINAPRKELVLIPGAGHYAFYYQSDRFLHELVTRVRPLALEPGPQTPSPPQSAVDADARPIPCPDATTADPGVVCQP